MEILRYDIFFFSIFGIQLGFYSNCFYFLFFENKKYSWNAHIFNAWSVLISGNNHTMISKIGCRLRAETEKKVQTVVKQYYENYHTLVLSLQILFWWQTSSTKRFANASSQNCNCDHNKPHNHFFVIYICLVTQYFSTLKVLIMHKATKYASWHNRKYWQEKMKFQCLEEKSNRKNDKSIGT